MLEYALISDVYKVDSLPSGRTKHKTARKSGEQQQDDMSRRRLESSPQPRPVGMEVAEEEYMKRNHLLPYEGPMYYDAKGRYPARIMEHRPVVYETFAPPAPSAFGNPGIEPYGEDHECRCRVCNRRMKHRQRRKRDAYDLESLMRNVLFSFAIGAFAVYLIDVLRSRR